MSQNKFDPHQILKKGKTIYLIGEVLIALALVYMAGFIWDILPAGMTDSFTDVLIVFAVCWGVGIPVVLYGRPIKKRGERYMTYLAIARDDPEVYKTAGGLIKQGHIPDLANIGKMLKVSEPVVRREIGALMEHGYMKGCFINEDLHALVTPRNAKQAENIKTLLCTYCGARNEYVPGKATYCVNCGAEVRL